MYFTHLKHAVDLRVTRDGFALIVFVHDPDYVPTSRAYYDVMAAKLKASKKECFKPVIAMNVIANEGAVVNIDPASAVACFRDRTTKNVFLTLDKIEVSKYEEIALAMLTEIDATHDLGLMSVLETIVTTRFDRSSWITSGTRMVNSRVLFQ